MSDTRKTKEQIYDEQVNPLMAQVIKICQEVGIPFVTSFQLTTDEEDEDGAMLCTSCNLPKNATAPCLEEAKRVIYDKPRIWSIATILRDAK
jgi:hypothetical protein